MAKYVDGFVLVVPKKNFAKYRAMARWGKKLWLKYGALDYKECVGEDLKNKWGVAFPRAAKTKNGETVVFSYIVYKSRAHRDRVNAKVMKDKRLSSMMGGQKMPFDFKRMLYGGFKAVVDL